MSSRTVGRLSNTVRALIKQIHRRCHAIMPDHIPARYEDLEIVRHNVGFRPEREEGLPRVEAETTKDGLSVVHCYGPKGGYVFGFGMSLKVKELVLDLVESQKEPKERARL